MFLNDKLSCLYYIDLGTFDDLYEKMNISRDEYPEDKYGSYRIGKFGLSDDVSSRITQHKNKKDGYGRMSSNVSMKWAILLSPSQLSKAENLLSTLLKAGNFDFSYTDTTGAGHKELIMFAPNKEHQVKKIYKQVLTLYPSRENELASMIEDNEAKYEAALLKKDYDHMIELTTVREEKVQEREERLKAQYEVDLLKLKLRLAQNGIDIE